MYFATWTPPASAEGGTATIQAKLPDSEQGDEVEIALTTAALPVDIVHDLTELAEDDTEFELSCWRGRSARTRVEWKEISLQTAGAKVLDGPKDLWRWHLHRSFECQRYSRRGGRDGKGTSQARIRSSI